MIERKPPNDRTGNTHKIRVGPVKAFITVNRDEEGNIIEVFSKADVENKGHLDMACRIISLGIQGRADVPTLIRHMSFDRTHPTGGPGQPTSIYDAIAKVLKKELDNKG